jgi:hypothetical protein
MRRYWLAASALVLSSCASLAPSGPAIEILACGVAEPLGRTGKVNAPGTSLGYVHEVDARAIPAFVQQCPAVEVGVGDRIGLAVRVLGDLRVPSIQVATRVTHPPIRNPGEATSRVVDEWIWPLDTRYPRYTGWSFDHDWEVVAGTWTLEVLHEGRTLASRTLTVKVK